MPLIPMESPHVKVCNCDVDRQARAVGMSLNVKKTNILLVNPTSTVQAIPFVAITDGEPVPIVDEMRLLGMLLDEKMSWWPMTLDIARRCNAKIC